MINKNIPIPQNRTWTLRVTDHHKSMQIGDSTVVDYNTATALIMWFQNNDKRGVRRKLAGDNYRVWRVA